MTLISMGHLLAGKSSLKGPVRTSCSVHGLTCNCEVPQDSKGQPRASAGDTLPQLSKGPGLREHCRYLKYAYYILICLFHGRGISACIERLEDNTWVLGLKLLKLLEADVL